MEIEMLVKEEHYLKIANAIEFIKENHKQQPSLYEIADHVNLSPFYFQRIFSDWAGVSPKKFMQYLSIEYAKELLKTEKMNLLDAAYETGLSGTSRLHDLFVNIEGMTPGDFKREGEHLKINFRYAESPFGYVLVASTDKGVCHLSFFDDAEHALLKLKNSFPLASFIEQGDQFQQDALSVFYYDWKSERESRAVIRLHLKGSAFQLKVWQALLKIPMGNLSTYGNVATVIDNPKASRAVGSAIGCNPIAFLIPCHRVIQSSGNIGGYRWGDTRKSTMIGWEGVQLHQ